MKGVVNSLKGVLMNSATINTLIAVGGTLLGALVGAITGFVFNKIHNRGMGKEAFIAIKQMSQDLKTSMHTATQLAQAGRFNIIRISTDIPWDMLMMVSAYKKNAFLLCIRVKQLLDSYHNLIEELCNGPIQHPNNYSTMWKNAWVKINNTYKQLNIYIDSINKI